MNEKIPFKKDIIFKSIIGEITDITLTHDYKTKDDAVEGMFYLSGKYKMTEATVIEEDFFYNIPFSIAIGERINKDTVNLVIDSFDYKIKKDVLSISINLMMNFEENEIETAVEEVLREEEIEIEKNEVNENLNIDVEDNVVTKENTNNILNFAKNNIEGDIYSTYKVINMRNNETIENIMSKYNITMEDIKLLNDVEDINTNNKIIIPIIKNE